VIKYTFTKPLKRGVIQSRPNRFVMFVEANRETWRCRCPSPTKIGNLAFKSIPCLLSANTDKRKTAYTVEAIAVKNIFGKRCWVGINQTKINAICKYFIDQGQLPRLIKDVKLERGGRVGNSIIDFVAEDLLLEIKTPLTVLPNLKTELVNYAHTGEYERTIRHCQVLTKHAEAGKRAILLLAYLYPTPLFNPYKQNPTNKKFLKTVQQAARKGVEFWQVNFTINSTGITLLKYAKLRLHKN